MTTTATEDTLNVFITQPHNYDGRSREAKLVKRIKSQEDYLATEGIMRRDDNGYTQTSDYVHLDITTSALATATDLILELFKYPDSDSIRHIITHLEYRISWSTDNENDAVVAMTALKFERMEDGSVLKTEVTPEKPQYRSSYDNDVDSWYNILHRSKHSTNTLRHQLDYIAKMDTMEQERQRKIAEARDAFVMNYREQHTVETLAKLMDWEPTTRGWSDMDREMNLLIQRCVAKCAKYMSEYLHKTNFEAGTPWQFRTYETEPCRVINSTEAYAFTVAHAISERDFIPPSIVADVLKSFGEELKG